MSSETQVEMDWAATGEAGLSPESARNGAAGEAYLTDEEILGIESPSPAVAGGYGGRGRHSSDQELEGVIPSARTKDSRRGEARNLSSIENDGNTQAQRDSSGEPSPRNDSHPNATAQGAFAQMPAWMQSAAADPQHGAEAQNLWREHQEFRAAFGSPEEARAVRELLPGGVRDVLSLREATQSVERIDAALFSGDARAQAEVVAELARANPAAFRSLFAEAANVLAGLGERGNEAGSREARNSEAGGWRQEAGQLDGDQKRGVILSEAKNLSDGVAIGKQNVQRDSSSPRRGGAPQNDSVVEVGARAANASSVQPPASNLQNFDPAAYAAFERSTNDAVARNVRGSISDTLARVLPEGVAEGAARRIGEDIFHEIHRALAADRDLSEQVAAVLRAPSSAAADYGGQARGSLGEGGARFGVTEQQRVTSLLAGRAKQLVPSVARRVIGEWTSSVLNTSRSKAARQAAAASRVDIAAPGGSSAAGGPLRRRAGSREVDYASMSDEEILGM
jgi:hypothetical protein